MTALTKEMRQSAIVKAMAQRFKDDDAKLEAQRTALGDAVYAHEFGQLEPIAKQLPEHWMESGSSVCIACDGFKTYRQADGPEPHLPLTSERRLPANGGRYIEINAKHPLYKQAQAIVKSHHALLDAKAKLCADLKAILFSCNTVKQLQEHWPEGVQFVPAALSSVTAVVPVSAIKRVNDALGLGKVKQAATA